ncbi:DUF488 family protein [Companilactobacillus allii]|uniref:MarR family transcriptional regulator n=1 Tax=Companilactobacillus allii TaxID=1847728 RepID=A0A1P8Q0L2_9LACO|nr:DUF488 family protein [Companilactobacillus allii]APX71365.1 hypothetical protein BTM29_01820 [Companilactobacillus allii]USQ68447.1 DUF488 family protein [Companilactobacillus allii]
MSKIVVKRIYNKDLPAGYRILVDRLWPRGISKINAKLDLWAKNISPSTELRKWFGHDEDKYEEFEIKYTKEIENNEYTTEFIKIVEEELKKQDVLFLYGAKDEECNNAEVLEEYLNKLINNN